MGHSLTTLSNKSGRHGSSEGPKVYGTEGKGQRGRDGLRGEISLNILPLGPQRKESQSALPTRKCGSMSALDSDQPNQQLPL